MANSKLVFTISSVLLALMFFNSIFSALGRPLIMKRAENKEHVMTTTYENSVKEMATVVGEGNMALWRRHILENEAAATTLDSHDDDEVEKWIDDFRPTDPGHSPGAGHSSPHSVSMAANGSPMP